MEYLNRVLGMRTRYLDEALNPLPNYIEARYRIQKAALEGKELLFVYPKKGLEAVSSVRKHIEHIERLQGLPVVLVVSRLTCRQKEYLLQDHIPFVVEGRQIYLPFMAVYLQQRGDEEKQEAGEMLPSAQVLLLDYIYHGCGKMLTSEASRRLGFTATSISRASRQLEEMGLIHAQKQGVQKLIYSDQSPEELFAKAKGRMMNPVKKRVYVPKAEVAKALPASGYSALSMYTMMNPPAVACFAAGSIRTWEKSSSAQLYYADDQYEVELWRYDPDKLAVNGCVDKLSLALSFEGNRDERVEEAVEQLLLEAWREIDGQRA